MYTSTDSFTVCPTADLYKKLSSVHPNVIDFTHPTYETNVSISGCNALSIVMVPNISRIMKVLMIYLQSVGCLDHVYYSTFTSLDWQFLIHLFSRRGYASTSIEIESSSPAYPSRRQVSTLWRGTSGKEV